MKRGGTISQSLPIAQALRPNNNQDQTNPKSAKSESVSENTVPMVKSEEIQNEGQSIMEEEKASTGKKDDEEYIPPAHASKNKRNQRQTREIKNLTPTEPKERPESTQKKVPKKPKAQKELVTGSIEKSTVNTETIDEAAEPKKLFEGNQKEKIEIVERWLAKFETSQEKTAEAEGEAKLIRADLDAAKELVKAARAITGVVETNPVKELKKDITRVFHDLMKSPDTKAPEVYIDILHKRLEGRRVELLEEFKQKVSEEEIRNLITKMKESRIDLKNELSKLIEICLEYQLRWGKLQTEIAAFQSKSHDFNFYQSAMERFCRLRLMTPNYEQTINQFFEVKAAQIHLEYFFACLQKFDLTNELQAAYSNDTNELDSELIFLKLQTVSINTAKEMIAQTTRPTQISCTFGDSFEELTQAIKQAETFQKEMDEALKNYQKDQAKEPVLSQAEKSLQSRLFFDGMQKLKPFNPRIIPRLPVQPVKVKKVPPKVEAKTCPVDSDDESSEEFKLSRRNKKVKQEVVPQLSVATRSTRSRPQLTD